MARMINNELNPVKSKWDNKLPYVQISLLNQRSFPVPAYAKLEGLNKDIAEITEILDKIEIKAGRMKRILVQKKHEREEYIKRHVG